MDVQILLKDSVGFDERMIHNSALFVSSNLLTNTRKEA